MHYHSTSCSFWVWRTKNVAAGNEQLKVQVTLWWRSVTPPVLVPSSLWGPWPDFTAGVLNLLRTLSSSDPPAWRQSLSDIYIFQIHYSRVPQPGFREMSLGVPREIVIEKNKHRFLNLLAKINRSTENSILYSKWHWQLLLDYYIYNLLITLDVDIIIFMQGVPETWKLFQGLLQGKKIQKGCTIAYT
jgi:hypothetical protein